MYLAASGTWVSRDDVVYLLWPDKGETKARSSLRQLLYGLNDVAFATGLEREADRIRWNVSTDLEAFEAAVDRGDLRAAIDLYAGPLLQGFHVDRTPEFASWVELERERLHGAWRRAGMQRAESLRTTGRHQAAVEILESLLEGDAFDEDVLRATMHALADAGRGREALAAYEVFEQRLQREIGVEPSAETVDLAAGLRRGIPTPSLAPSRAVATAGPNVIASAPRRRARITLPVDTTAFVGRSAELEELAGWIENGRSRLVSLVAPGGMGKSRLALALARALEARFLDGAAFASLASVEEPSQMAASLADALGLQPSPHTPIQDQLVWHLSELDVLLVLDQLEHLTDDLSLLTLLLERCPGLMLVTTSRERLNLDAEWVYDVRGLDAEERERRSTESHATSDPTAAGGHGRPQRQALASDAAELFLRTARRTSGGLDVDGLDPADVYDLCWRVRGMPLAIVLAAGWLRVMSLPEIRAELDRGLDILASPREPAPDRRHASIRAVLGSTWKRLRPTERRTWMWLSVAEGGFDRDAADAIAGIGPSGLLALMNKAILTRSEQRFDMHPLVREFGRERAEDQGVLEDARSRHAGHYLRWIVAQAPGFEGPDQMDVVHRTTRELPNLRAAWRSAARFGWADLLADATHGVATYHDILGLRGELAALAEDAIVALGGLEDLASAPIDRQRAVGRALPFAHGLAGGYAERARHSLEIARRIGDERGRAEAHLHLVWAHDPPDRENADEARAAFERVGDEHGIARTDVALGFPLVLHGYYREGIETAFRAAERFERLGDQRLMALALDDMTPGHIMLGEFDVAEELLLRQEEINRRVDVWTVDIQSLGSRQWLEMERGDFEAAQHYQDLYHETFERAGRDMATNRLFLGSGLRYKAGRYDEAWGMATEFMERVRGRGNRPLVVFLVVVILARIATRRGDIAGARQYVREAIEIGFDIGSPRFLLDAAVAAAEWLSAVGSSELALHLVAAAKAHPATEIAVRKEIDRLRSEGLDPSHTDDPHDLDWVRGTLAEILDHPP